jgi:hypothetical protein
MFEVLGFLDNSLISTSKGGKKHPIEAGGGEGIWGKNGDAIRTPGR